jgi:hypothetical protein
MSRQPCPRQPLKWVVPNGNPLACCPRSCPGSAEPCFTQLPRLATRPPSLGRAAGKPGVLRSPPFQTSTGSRLLALAHRRQPSPYGGRRHLGAGGGAAAAVGGGAGGRRVRGGGAGQVQPAGPQGGQAPAPLPLWPAHAAVTSSLRARHGSAVLAAHRCCSPHTPAPVLWDELNRVPGPAKRR